MTVIESKFRRWVCEFGASNLADALNAADRRVGCTRFAVYGWLRGAHEPRPPRAREIVRLSRGRVSLDDVHAHFEVTRR